MFKKIVNSLILFSIVFTGFIFHSTFVESERAVMPPSPGSSPDRFYYGAIQTLNDQPNYYNYDLLDFNLWHTYTETETGQFSDSDRQTPRGPSWVSGWPQNDHLLTDVTEYASDLVTYISSSILQHNQTKLLWQRPKIEWLAYGQSSTYEAEYVDPNSPLWFYSFQVNAGESIVDNQYDGNGHTVLHSSESVLGPGGRYILQRLKANTEQCRGSYNGTQNINGFQSDEHCDWLVKPRIRIPASFPATNPEAPVCRIIVYKQDATIKKEQVILAKHFHQSNNPNPYDGGYLEEFYFNQTPNENPSAITFNGALGSIWFFGARGNGPDGYNSADIQVYWYDNCEIWIDYVKVENDVADELMNPSNPYYNRDNQWIDEEYNLIAKPTGAVFKYYIELAEFNNLPCINHINQRLRALDNQGVDLIWVFWPGAIAIVPYSDAPRVSNPEWIYPNVMQRGGFSMIYAQCYPFTSVYHDPPDPNLTFSRIPNTLPKTTCNGENFCGIMACATNPDDYDTWLQNNLNHRYYYLETGVPIWPSTSTSGCWLVEGTQEAGLFRYVMQTCNKVSQLGNIPFVYMPQVHLWFYPEENLREPTNEELDLLANLGVSYGAKSLMWWWYPSFDDNPIQNCPMRGRGIAELGNVVLRTNNFYNQSKYKWQTIKDIGTRMKIWEPYLMSFDNIHTNSYIYNFEDERNDLSNISNSYIHALRTFKPGYPQIYCQQDNLNFENPSGMIYECPDSTYLQVAKFGSSDATIKYFMIVNRRCSPYISDLDEDHRGGKRDVRILFYQDHSAFNGYQTWKITDVAVQGYVPIYFDKSAYTLLDLGDFLPGEGKLYKIEPVMKKGGILQADEVISGVEFTCEDTVFNNGHNITLGSNTTVHFTDTSQLVMNGGTFQMGDSSYHGSPNVTANAVSGYTWPGLSFTNCTVKIYNTTFSNIKNDTSYALNIIDCHTVDIRNSVFNTNSGDLNGGIGFTYYNQSGMPPNAYIGGNNFNWDKSKVPAINIMSDAGTIMPVIIENNTLNSSSTTGSTAIMLSGISGGAVKNNYMYNFDKSITALSSSLDIAENTISSDINSSIAINTGSGTEIRLNNVGVEILGGMNNISNTDSSSINIKVDNSYFLIDNGQNLFNIADSQSSYHLKGYFPSGYSYGPQATQNCFKVNNSQVEPPIDSVTVGEGGDQPGFNFYPYLTGCTMGGFGQQMIVNLGDGIYDTIDTRNGGGGEPNIFILTPKTLYDSISIQMRYRNYNYVKTKCTELINTYTDSIQSLNSISKLYLATTATDTTQAGMSALKTFYENLILNHTYNTALVKRCNYFVQKCKVKLKQYSSALAGFQQIINENPYSYEGLVAKWDYMATHLLDSLGQGGGLESEASNVKSETDEESNDPRDKSPWTKEQKKVIKTAINISLQDSRKSDELKIEGLTHLAKSGNVDAEVKLKVMKTLKEVIKTQAPKTIIEHIKIVNNDIQKVFSNPISKSKSKGSNLPTVFYLSQNYPNPFNPTTKINFDIPKDVKVKIMVYDVLGREVIKLVDEFKKAGRYIVEFNGNNYASGVYFYRIEAGEFVLAKKMVLIK